MIFEFHIPYVFHFAIVKESNDSEISVNIAMLNAKQLFLNSSRNAFLTISRRSFKTSPRLSVKSSRYMLDHSPAKHDDSHAHHGPYDAPHGEQQTNEPHFPGMSPDYKYEGWEIPSIAAMLVVGALLLIGPNFTEHEDFQVNILYFKAHISYT